MKKLWFVYFLFSCHCLYGQKFIELKARAIMAQAVEFSLLEAVAVDGRSVWIPDSLKHANDCKFFPIHEGDKYKLVYWKKYPSSVVCGTVTFDNNLSAESVVIDSSIRNFTIAEKHTLNQILKVSLDLAKDGKLHISPDVCLITIPINTVWGSKVFVMQRFLDSSRYLFGADLVYVFNAENDIVSKRMSHSKDRIYLKEVPADTVLNGAFFHSHENDDTDGALISDLGSMMLYNAINFRWKEFAIATGNNVFVMDLETFHVTEYDHDQYKALNMQVKAIE